ncbi:hypothetical protein FQN54_008153 [Arachnomyces sp. PD_36]|nr:hypothetical protein FQN54_008153 [Arachnomyces sp. PD_36]
MSQSISEKLDALIKDTFQVCDNDEATFEALNAKASYLAMQVGVLGKLKPIAQLIRRGETLPIRKLNFNIKKLSDEDAKGSAHGESRWASIQKTGCQTAIFCMVSFSGLASLRSEEFSWLLRNAEKYMETQQLPSGWLAREQIRKVLASYHKLEVYGYNTCSPSAADDEPVTKRIRTDGPQQELSGSPKILSSTQDHGESAADPLTGDVYELTVEDAQAVTVSDQIRGQIWLTNTLYNSTPFITIPVSRELSYRYATQRPRVM